MSVSWKRGRNAPLRHCEDTATGCHKGDPIMKTLDADEIIARATTRMRRPPTGREAPPVQISALLHAHEIVIKEARAMARRAADAADDGTNDLLVSGLIRRNELQAWFLAEHVVLAPLQA